MFDAKKLPTVLTAEELIDKAFRRASKISSRNARERAINKLATVSNVLSAHFDKVIRSHPSYDSLPEFYREMIDLLVGLPKVKKSLAALKWANEMVQKIVTKSIHDIKRGKKPDQVKKVDRKKPAPVRKTHENTFIQNEH